MCFDPVSLGLMAAGTGLSLFGNSAAKNDQAHAILRDTQAKNAVLTDTLGKEKGFQDQNLGAIKDITGRFDPTVQAGNLADATTSRNNAITGAITAPEAAPTNPDTPQIVKSAIANKMLDAFNYSTDLAKAKAKAAAYGDVAGGNARAISDASGNIDMTNNFAKGTASILPDQQAFAGASVYQPPSALGPTLSSLGTLMAGLGGSGRAANFSLPSVPGFNPIAGVAG